MAWTSGTSSGYRDLLTKLTDFACSQHISAVVVNDDGANYTAGDILTITHASAHLDAKIEVLTVDGSGNILTYALREMGAFAAQVVSAVVSAGGTGYTTGDIVQVEGGTWTNRAKFTVTAAAGVVSAVTLFEGGGSYTAFPSNPASVTGVGPTNGNDDLTLTLTTQAIIGTTGIAATGGTGTGATFDLTLTDTGHTAVRNLNNYSVNSITDEKDVILQGTAGGMNDPYVGFRSYTQTSGPSTRYGWIQFAMDSFNDGLATGSQVGIAPTVDVGTTGVNFLMFNVSELFWFYVTGRRIVVVRKAQGGALLTYQSMHSGLMNPVGTETESPYPMYLSGSTSVSNRLPDASSNLVTGLTELRSESSTACPAFFRHPGTGVYTRVQNINGTTSLKVNTLYPLGESQHADGAVANADRITIDSLHEFYSDFSDPAGSSPALLLYPSIGDDEHVLVPCIVKSTPTSSDNDVDTTPRGELDGVYWLSGKKGDGGDLTPEDTITDGSGQRYRVFINAGRVQPYSFFAVKEA